LRAWAGNAVWRETLVFLFEKLSAKCDSSWLDDLAEAVFRDPSGEWLDAEHGDDARFALAASDYWRSASLRPLCLGRMARVLAQARRVALADRCRICLRRSHSRRQFV